MFSRISCEFEMVEFAESAAKRIEDTVDGPKKIRIIPKRNKYKSSYNSNEIPSENNELFVLLPAAVTSYNYITGQITRPVDKSKYKEPLLTNAVILEVTFEQDRRHEVSQILTSSGGYDMHTCVNSKLR